MSKKTKQDVEREDLLLALEQLSETLTLMQRVTQALQFKLAQGPDSTLTNLLEDWQTDHHPALQQALHDLPDVDGIGEDMEDPLRCETPIVIH